MHANCMSPVYSWWDACDDVNSDDERRNTHFPEHKPFNSSHANDMSAGWKLTKKVDIQKLKNSFATVVTQNPIICTCLMRLHAHVAMKFLTSSYAKDTSGLVSVKK